MTDDPNQADYLDSLAAAIRRLEGRMDTLDQQRLEALLGAGDTSRTGSIGLPTMQLGASDTYRTLGNVQPLVGQVNLLADPAFEQVDTVSPIGTVESTGDVWRAKYVLNSGTAPTTREWSSVGTSDAFNGGEAALTVLPGAVAGSTTYYAYPVNGFLFTQYQYPLPYLVAAIRAGDYGNNGTSMTNITTCEATLEIYDQTSGTVVASSPVLDLKAMNARKPEIQQLVATLTPMTLNHEYKWRIKLLVVATGTGGKVVLRMGEPQIHMAYSPDPVLYTPAKAQWKPRRLAPALATGGNVFPSNPAFYDVAFRNDLGAWYWYDSVTWDPVGSPMASLTYSYAGSMPINTSIELKLADAASTMGAGRSAHEMPWGGWIVGCSIMLKAGRTAGAATLRPQINGVNSNPTLQVDSVNTFRNNAKALPGLGSHFAAGALVGLDLDTSAAWAPTGANEVQAILYLMFDQL